MDHCYASHSSRTHQGSSTDDLEIRNVKDTTGNVNKTLSHCVQKNVVVIAGQKVKDNQPMETNVDSVHLAGVRRVNTDSMSGPAPRQRTEKEKMVLLQKQLLEIQRKQTQCLLKLKQESKKVQKLERDAQKSNINRENLSLTKEQVVAGAKRFMTEPVVSFFADQMDYQESEGEVKSRRWSLETRRFALEMYFLSAPAYQFLENVFHLPDTSEIKTWAEKGMDCV